MTKTIHYRAELLKDSDNPILCHSGWYLGERSTLNPRRVTCLICRAKLRLLAPSLIQTSKRASR
jgi:hypothetical protein